MKSRPHGLLFKTPGVSTTGTPLEGGGGAKNAHLGGKAPEKNSASF